MESFVRICRSCNKEKQNLLNLFSREDSENEPTLGEKFQACTTIAILENDDLPQAICYACTKQLENAFKFQIQSLTANAELCAIVLREKPVDVGPGSDAREVAFKAENEEVLGEVTTKSDDVTELDVESVKYEDLENSQTVLEIMSDDEISSEMNFDDDNGQIAIEEGTDADIYVMSEEDQLEEFHLEESQNELLLEESTVQYDDELSEEHESEEFHCDPCNKHFLTKKALDLHIKVVHKIAFRSQESNSSDFLCNLCDVVYLTQKALDMHNRLTHKTRDVDELESITNFCEICGKNFKSEALFTSHLKMHNTNSDAIKRHRCEVCLKKFRTKAMLKQHMIYHIKKDYTCSICDKNFNLKYKYTDHLRRFHASLMKDMLTRKKKP